MDQPGKVTNSALGKLNRRRNDFLPSPFPPENLVSLNLFGHPVLYILRLNLVLPQGILPDFRGGVHLFEPSPTIGSVRVYQVTQLRIDGFTAESPPIQGQQSSIQSSSSNGCCLYFHELGCFCIMFSYFAFI